MGDLKTFSINTENGEISINGKEIKNVTALSLTYSNGKYSLVVSLDKLFKAKAPLSKKIVVS